MMRLPWHGKTAPHAVLDILRGCNCRCANCYNAAAPLNCKSLDALNSMQDGTQNPRRRRQMN